MDKKVRDYLNDNIISIINLKENEKISNLMVESLFCGDWKKAIDYIKKHANIHTDDDFALRWSSEQGYLYLIKYLVKNDLNIDEIKDELLLGASENGHLDVVKYLIKNGANIHGEEDGPLIYALQNEHIDIIKYLKSKI